MEDWGRRRRRLHRLCACWPNVCFPTPPFSPYVFRTFAGKSLTGKTRSGCKFVKLPSTQCEVESSWQVGETCIMWSNGLCGLFVVSPVSSVSSTQPSRQGAINDGWLHVPVTQPYRARKGTASPSPSPRCKETGRKKVGGEICTVECDTTLSALSVSAVTISTNGFRRP